MKQYKTFLLTSVLFSIIVFTIDLTSEYNTIDINVHDTYFIIAKFLVWFILTIFLGILTCVYFILHKMKRKTSYPLPINHYLLTIVPLIVMPILNYYTKHFKQMNVSKIVVEC